MAQSVRLFVLFVLGFLTLAPSGTVADDTEIKATGPNVLGQKVEVSLEVRGNISAEFDGESATSLPMEVDGKFDYRERQLRSQRSTRYVRNYATATAQIDYGHGQVTSTLSKDHEWIIADRRANPEQGKRVRFLTSTAGLKQNELDLLTIPASTLVLDSMLGADKVRVSQQWTPNDDLLADFLTIDKVRKNEVKLELTRVERGVAEIRISGDIEGLIDDAETEIHVQGTCEFDLSAGFTRHLRLTLQENRTICESAPGFDAVTKLEMRVTRPSDDILPQQEIESKQLSQRKWNNMLVVEDKSADFRVRYDSRWRLISNEVQGVVLRLVDENLLLGQCTFQNLKSLPSLDGYSMEDFRRDVTKTTADKGLIVDDDSFTSDGGLQVMRIDVKGKSDDIEVTWRYYHVAQADGQRLSFDLTFDSEVAARFEDVDRRLIDSIEFLRTTPTVSRADTESTTK